MTRLREAAGPLAVLTAVLVGVAAGHAVGPSPATRWLMAAGLSGIAAVASAHGRAFLALVGLALLALGLTARAHHGIAVTPLDAAAVSGDRVLVDASLVGDPSPRRWETTAIVKVRRYEARGTFRSGGGRHVVVRAARPVSSRLAVLAAGDRVRVAGRLGHLRPFEAARRDLHLVAEVEVHDVIDVRPTRSPLLRAASAVRGAVLDGVAHVPSRHRALVAGFLLGDTRGLTPGLHESFRSAGLSHLLVVSGSNVAFVLALLGPLRHRLGLAGRLVTGLAVVVVFAAATRFEPSVLRASVMAALAMFATFSGRPAPGLRLLVLTVVGLVLVDPLLVHSIAFRLSCAASAGILVLAGPLAKRIPGPVVVRDSLATTSAAQLGVAPVLLPLAGGLPLVALPANLAAAWAAGPLTMWGLTAGSAAWAVDGLSAEVAELLHVPTTALAGYLETVATVAGSVPLFVGTPVVAGLAGAIALGLLTAGRRRRLGSDGSHPPPGSARS